MVPTKFAMLRHKSLRPLSRQHHNALALCVLARRALEADSSLEAVAGLAVRVAGRFRLEMANHFELEERELFPAVRDELGGMEILDELVAEHRRMERIVARLDDSASESDLRDFITLLRSHIRREEYALFEDIQSRLRPETLARLGAELEARAVRIPLEPEIL